MKNFIFSCITIVCSVTYAQQPTYVLNGKTYFIYPYQEETTTTDPYFRMGIKQEEVLKRDSLNRTILSTEVKNIKYPIPMETRRVFKKHNKIYFALRASHPEILYNYNIPLEQDVTPTLEPLADGNYVQFYRDLPYIKDGVIRYRNDRISAVFTLKNNQLNGFAYWLTATGDTIKAGNFVNGLKEGSWFHHTYSYYSKDSETKLSGYTDGSYKDTSTVEASYKNGLFDGPFRVSENNFVVETGYYKNGLACGEWKHYERKRIVNGIVTTITDELVLTRHYFIPEKPVKGKSVIVRDRIMEISPAEHLEYNLPYDVYFDYFSDYYRLYQEKEEQGLELPEEASNSYPGAIYDGGYEGDYNVTDINDLDFRYMNMDNNGNTYLNGKAYSRNELIDSLGYEFMYEGVYEEFHNNGQLKMRFEIRDGNLVREDTIFWDNGNPANVVTYDPVAKEYSEKTYDLDKKLMKHLVFDEKGDFLRSVGANPNQYLIDNKMYVARSGERLYNYNKMDTLYYNLVNPEVLEEQLWRFNKMRARTTVFTPGTRTYEEQSYSIDNRPIYRLNLQFGDDYENLNGTESYTVGKLESFTQLNGSYLSNPIFSLKRDTVLNKRIRYWRSSYTTEYDNILNYEGAPFSGKFTLNAHKKKFRLKASDSQISFDFANGKSHIEAMDKAYKSYVQKGKSNKLTSFITPTSTYTNDASNDLLVNLAPFITTVFRITSPEHFIEYKYINDMESRKRLREKQAAAFDKTVEGQFLNGKPEGLWITRDQHGHPTAKVNFVNGEIDGEALFYETAYPKPDEEEYYYEYEFGHKDNPLLRDSFPSKPTHYLSRSAHYKNGILNGSFVETNWMGDTIANMTYVNGVRQGTVFERSKLAFSISEYEDGELDGIAQTYLTLPGKDTTRLYDLNFQNGMLQGESKAYHLNGKIAKHGFFYLGQPIDDFEAFDTLGFRYQYVKFQYNQPVEEKIWEENQLSVRYEFDWRDSIYFNTSDIAGSTSLNQLLYEIGVMGSSYDQMPYYGRPSLVDKSGINYRMTKYYPNDTIAREGDIASGKKVGCWRFYDYEGKELYEVDYFDSIITVNDSIRFKSKGILTYSDSQGYPTSRSYIVEKFEKYDCAHTDHYEIRMLVTFWEKDTSIHRMNGYVKNYYDNGVLQNEGWVKNGVATGVWKFYDPYGSLNEVGEYKTGKRQGRWLSGDLSHIKYMGDICLNPNLQNLDEIMSYQEKLLDISVIYYQMGAVKKREYYGLNLNSEGPPQNYIDEEMYYESGAY